MFQIFHDSVAGVKKRRAVVWGGALLIPSLVSTSRVDAL
jgi:hypothetical protein